MEQELAYSFHLGSDKNKSKVAKRTAKENVSGTTSLSNNAIQNANDLSRVNKHNLRDYDNKRELITTIYGTNDIVEDVKQVYIDEFEESRIEFNNKQTRNDRKINNYFEKACTLQNDIACEIIIELGDMDFWQDKDDEYRFKMIDVYNEQIQDLNKIVPNFKVANATIHFDETSPHMHVVGIPVIDNCKKGMKKQVGKSKVFTKESLTVIQDKMRNACIKSYNKFYGVDSRLKTKQKGRNKDIHVKEMDGYRELKKEQEKNAKKLKEANNKSDKLNYKTEEINNILDNLKPSTFNKNNKQISNEDVEKIKNYAKEVEDTTRSIKGVNNLNVIIDNIEKNYKDLVNDRDRLYYSNNEKDTTIANLKEEIEFKNKKINKLELALDKVKTELSRFKDFWRRLIKRFQIKIMDEKFEDIPQEKRNYTIVAEDLVRSGIFDDNDAEIVKNPRRKILTKDELNEIQANKGKNKNDYNLS